MFGITTIDMDVLGGDLQPGYWQCSLTQGSGTVSLRRGLLGKPHALAVRSVELITEENKGKLLRTTGWALAGFAMLGPLGSIAGMLATSTKKKVCFAVRFSDGRGFVATTDVRGYQQLVAASFNEK